MLLIVIPHLLVFILLSRGCVNAELVNNHHWTTLLSSLRIKFLKETRSSLTVTSKNSLCAEHVKIYMDQINSSYWATQSEYSTFLAKRLM
jgi:hypothetical protein